MLAKLLRFVLKGCRLVVYLLGALWLAAFYGLLGDIEGFDRWLNWVDGRRRD